MSVSQSGLSSWPLNEQTIPPPLTVKPMQMRCVNWKRPWWCDSRPGLSSFPQQNSVIEFSCRERIVVKVFWWYTLSVCVWVCMCEVVLAAYANRAAWKIICLSHRDALNKSFEESDCGGNIHSWKKNVCNATLKFMTTSSLRQDNVSTHIHLL